MEKGSSERTDMLKIAVTGPESAGKSTLAEQLASTYQTIWVPEFAREFLTRRNGKYREKDLLKIAMGQLEAEHKCLEQADELLFCDTELIVIKIWSLVKYGRCHPFILERIEQQSFVHYLLCDIDIPWKDDPLREHPHFRKELLEMYISELNCYGFPYTIVHGNMEERLSASVQLVNKIMKGKSS